MAGAKVAVRNAATSEARQVQTDSRRLSRDAVAPGVYELSVEAQGFRRFVQSGIDLQVGQRARIDPRLTLGAVTRECGGHGQCPLLDTADAALGQAVENRKILDLPMNGRNIVGLAGLATGVVPGNGFGGGIPYGRAALIQAATANLSINGGLTATNDVFIDGVPLSICCQNQIAFLPSIDTTEEFRVRTNMFDAQFGRTGGGVDHLRHQSRQQPVSRQRLRVPAQRGLRRQQLLQQSQRARHRTLYLQSVRRPFRRSHHA